MLLRDSSTIQILKFKLPYYTLKRTFWSWKLIAYWYKVQLLRGSQKRLDKIHDVLGNSCSTLLKWNHMLSNHPPWIVTHSILGSSEGRIHFALRLGASHLELKSSGGLPFLINSPGMTSPNLLSRSPYQMKWCSYQGMNNRVKRQMSIRVAQYHREKNA